jgi:sugar transferase (PEP-CTERM/EpsH1 system associated)
MEELLFLAHRIPYPPNKGDKIRSWHILRHLARSYRIHLGAFIDDPRDRRYTADVEALCASTCLLPLSPRLARLRSLTGLVRGRALSLPYFHDRRMQDWVDARLQQGDLRRVFVFSSPMAQYVMHDNSPGMRRVVDFVDVDSDKWRQYAQSRPWPLSWLYRREGTALLKFDREVARRVDASLFVSPEEAALFRRLVPEAASAIGYLENGVDHEFFTPERDYPDPYDNSDQVLVFTGAMDYWANIDAVSWFAQAIFPRIRKVVSGAQFAIVGARPAREVQALASLDGVSVIGAVKDIRPYLAHARVVVAPLRIARGVQNKVLEAMAMAKPVVATRPAMEGIEHINPEALKVADEAQPFADHVVSLLQGSADHDSISSREWVRRRYDWGVNLARLNEVIEVRTDAAMEQTGSLYEKAAGESF